MSENIKVLTDFEFKEYICNEKLPILVDFYALWCTPCKMLAPVLNELADELKGKISFCKVNVDENEKTAYKYSVESIPTIMVFVGGNVKERASGLKSKAQLSEILIKYL